MNISQIASKKEGLTRDEIVAAIDQALSGKVLRRVLILPPDFTRYHSNAGLITQYLYHQLTSQNIEVDIMPALGTHEPVNENQWKLMFGDIPYEKMLVHRWRNDVVTLGVIPAEYIREITENLWSRSVKAEINRIVMEPKYDLIISIGQVVPHEVIGMSNHSKNLFVGVGGSEMIHSSHMIGAVYGMERMMGRDHTPVRKLFDYGMEHYLACRPLLFILTVTTADKEEINTHGIFIGDGRECLTEAIKLAQKKNIDFVPHGLKKCIVYLNPDEFRSTWLGNKAVYRTRMAMADGGELIVLAPGVDKFGEDATCDALIRKYGYRGRLHILNEVNNPDNADLQNNLSAAAHLIHGSSDGRFTIIYAVQPSFRKEIEAVGYQSADCGELMKKYSPDKLSYGINVIDGEECYFIPNPALGLWINKERFTP